MIVICCVCKKVIREDKSVDKGVISHTYCKPCLKKFREDNNLKSNDCEEVIPDDR